MKKNSVFVLLKFIYNLLAGSQSILWLTIISYHSIASSADPGPFNLGRTRCYFGGMSFSDDGKMLFHAHIFAKDSISAFTIKVAISRWSDNAWSNPEFPDFVTDYSESYPVWVQSQQRLYFSSNAPVSSGGPGADQNIWYAEKTSSGWNKPVLADGLNSDKNDRLSFVDNEGYYYVLSDRAGGSMDIFRTKSDHGKWKESEPLQAWNSEQQEEYVSVYPDQKIAFIQRSLPGTSTEIFISKYVSGSWAVPEPLRYEFKNTEWPYVHRWPMLSANLGTFYFVSQGIIWQQPAEVLLRQNGISFPKKKFDPLSVRKRAYGEPEMFGGLVLKTNNGISFAADMKTIYLSRYTQERDSSGNQFIKLFQSNATQDGWSPPVMTSFNNSQVPFEYHPVVSPDGKRLFYNSRAPVSQSGKTHHAKNNIWYVDKQRTGLWGQPKLVESIVTDEYDDYGSITLDGTLYFRSDRPGGKGSGDIYKSEFLNGQYQPPANVTALNSEDNENDLCIDPKGRFIVFNRYALRGEQPTIALYLSLQTETGWTKPRMIRHLEKAYDYELTPTLSPDGKYFYYEVNSNILRVETESLFLPEEKERVR